MEAPDDASPTTRRAQQGVRRGGDAFDEAGGRGRADEGNLDDAERRAKVLDDNPAPARARAGHPRRSSRRSTGPSRATDARSSRTRTGSRSTPTRARERLERHGRQNVEAIKRSAERETQRRREERAGVEGRRAVPVPRRRHRRVRRPDDPAVPRRHVRAARAGGRADAQPDRPEAAAAGEGHDPQHLAGDDRHRGRGAGDGELGVQETDFDDTLLTINVNTYAGQQDVSRQALERSEMVDAVIYQDLTSAYFTKIDAAILNGAGTSGTHLGIRNVSGSSP
jgi:hypothetical protein